MSDLSNRNNPHHHNRRGPRRRPEQANVQREKAKEPRPQGDVHLKGLRSLDKLRDSVEFAGRELKRLREENLILSTRISELEGYQVNPADQVIVSFDEDPEILRKKVASFIEAIDKYLAKDEGEFPLTQ